MQQKMLWPLGLLALLLVAPAVIADDSPPAEPAPCESAAHGTTEADQATALRVVIDAETGRLRAPTAEEAAAFAFHGAEKRDITTMPVEKAADGTLTVRLGGNFLKAAKAELDAEGKSRVTHDVVPVVPAPALPAPAVDAATDREESEQ